MSSTKQEESPLQINIVSFFYDPSVAARASRALALAKGLCERGHRVRVITADLGDPRFRHPRLTVISTPVGPVLRLLLREPVGPRSASGTPRLLLKAARVIGKRLYSPSVHTEWAHVGARFLADRAAELSADATICLAFPLASLILARKLRDKGASLGALIADYGDPISLNPYAVLSPRVQRMERSLLEAFRAVVIPTPNMAGCFHALGVKDRLHVIPHAADVSPALGREAGKRGTSGRRRALYGGAFYATKRDPVAFLKALRIYRARGNPPLEVVFRTSESARTVLSAAQADLTLEAEAKWEPVLPRERYLEELAGVEFALNFLNSGEVMVPSKKAEFAALGIPVFEIRPEDSPDELATRLERGDFVVYPKSEGNDVNKMVDSFLELIPCENEKKRAG